MTIKDEVTEMKAQQAAMRTDIHWLKKEQSEQNCKLDNISTKLSDFIDTANDKYATKTQVETIEKETRNNKLLLAKWSGAIGIIVTAVTIVANVLF